MKIGFLFNHDHAHQVAHSLPIALALAKDHEHEIILATAGDRPRAEARRIAGPLFETLRSVELDVSNPFLRRATKLIDPIFPGRKIAIYRDNLDFFRSLDVLVVADKTALILKKYLGLSALKFIHTRHGAGDRAIGFNAESALFDLILVSGPKIRDRLIAETGTTPDQIAVTGYAKFSLLDGQHPRLPVQENDRPTILYNPHPSPAFSSWFKMGPAILDYFRKSDRYNLIFAPHVMLFQRKVVISIEPPRLDFPGRIDPAVAAAPNILIDTGSTASIDMTYTRAADIYLGDASSQIYEFLHTPRPAIFANPSRKSWQGDPNFQHWTAGPVFETIDALDETLSCAQADFAKYRPIQERLFAHSFDVTDIPAPKRAADAIAAFLRSKPA